MNKKLKSFEEFKTNEHFFYDLDDKSAFTPEEIKKHAGNNEIIKSENPYILSWFENGEMHTIVKNKHNIQDVANKLGLEFKTNEHFFYDLDDMSSAFTPEEIKKYAGNNEIIKSENPYILSWFENGEMHTIVKNKHNIQDVANKLGLEFKTNEHFFYDLDDMSSAFTPEEIKKYAGNNEIIKSENPYILSWFENGEMHTIVKNKQNMQDVANKLGLEFKTTPMRESKKQRNR